MTIMQKILEEQLLCGESDLYAIYRLRRGKREYRFSNLEFLQEKGTAPHYEQYAPVYIGELTAETSLENLWNTFNVAHPDDYFTTSLSIGDVVVLRRGADLFAYFVDSFDYTELPNFIPKQSPEPVTHPMIKCLVCGKEEEQTDSELYCSRCFALITLLGCGLTLDNLAAHFWEECFGCGANVIAGIDLTGDNLTIQCDNCGDTHVIPFAPENITRYIRSGIIRENVEEYLP